MSFPHHGVNNQGQDLYSSASRGISVAVLSTNYILSRRGHRIPRFLIKIKLSFLIKKVSLIVSHKFLIKI